VSELSQSFLSERQGKEILSSWGVQILPGKLASSAHEAREIAESIGYPVAMKIESPDIVHKTEAGGVRLRLATGEEVHQAFEELSAIGEFVPGARVTGVFVEKMAGKGIELLVGASRDRDFGLCLTLGLGGIWTEILQDFAVRPLPISPWDADDMLRSLRGHALLCGARGMQVDRDAVVTTVVAIAEFAQAVGDDLVALDVNPLLVEIEGAYALDVRIQLRDKSMAHTEGSC
jgi:succinyl-CoA synthetase beta subunit